MESPKIILICFAIILGWTVPAGLFILGLAFIGAARKGLAERTVTE